MSRTGEALPDLESRSGEVAGDLDPDRLPLRGEENPGDPTWPILSAARAPTFGVAGAYAVVATALSLVSFSQAPLRAETLPSSHAAAACTLSKPPDTLWSLAQCCAKDLHSNPSCIEYDPKDKYVLVKDNAPNKPYAYLIIPSEKVTGIEDKQIFSAPFLNLWGDGWYGSRKYPGQPVARTGLAINSKPGRDQNQLHIHISCVRPDVGQTLETKDREIGVYPAKAVTLQLPPHNNAYEGW